MILDPTALLTSALSSPVAPIPTVVPPPPIYQKAGETGHRTLWAVTVIMGLSSIALYVLAWRVPVQKRLFHILTAFITTFAFLSYFAMASGDGTTYKHSIVTEQNKHVPDIKRHLFREVYWARYVDWSITTPLLLLDLSLLAGLSGANILVAIVSDVIMILTGLFAAYGSTAGQKWGWYTFGCIAYLTVVYQLAYNGRAAAALKDNKTKTFFISIASFTLILWTIYPIIWGIADGARLVNVDVEILAYAVLDILAKPVFGFWLIYTHDGMSSTSPSIEGFWAHGLGEGQGTIRVGDE